MDAVRRVAWISHRDGEACAACRNALARGSLILLRREDGIRCLECAGLADLVYLPAGDPALTRRALAGSSRSAIVVKFSRARRRHERQGVLVESSALQQAEAECGKGASRREGTRARRRVKDEAVEHDYVAKFAARILELFPTCPRADAEAIAKRACAKYSGRVGRSRAAKALDADAIRLAVRAHIRHRHTPYDDLIAQGREPFEVRPLVKDQIDTILTRWEGAT